MYFRPENGRKKDRVPIPLSLRRENDICILRPNAYQAQILVLRNRKGSPTKQISSSVLPESLSSNMSGQTHRLSCSAWTRIYQIPFSERPVPGRCSIFDCYQDDAIAESSEMRQRQCDVWIFPDICTLLHILSIWLLPVRFSCEMR